MRVALIHNPEAGGDDHPLAEELIRLIRDAGHSVVYQSTTVNGWEQVLQEDSDLVAVAGGDGIVSQVARRMIGDARPIAVLPVGTANNIANALTLRQRALDEWIRGWNDAGHQRFDAGVATGPWGTRTFIEALGVGLFADTMCCLDATNNIDIAHLNGAAEKLIAVLKIMRTRLAKSPAHPLHLVVDGDDLSGDYILVEVMNIRSVGPNLDLAPDADPRDGWFDVIVVAEDDTQRLHEYLSKHIDGETNLPALMTRRCQHVRIEGAALRIHIDDGLWPAEHSPPAAAIVDVQMAAGSLAMLMPA